MSLQVNESRVLAWWQLLRAGNVFTATSNVIAGFLVVRGEWRPAAALVTLVAASACLYEAGMVLNDVFDASLDATERPERPIPSARILRRRAMTVGWLLLGLGVGLSLVAARQTVSASPAVIGVCLAISIMLYDAGLKASWAGPLAMGWCRTLNVLLGASVAADLSAEPGAWLVAAAVGSYTAGITWLAREEVDGPRRGVGALIGEAALVVAVALLAVWGARFAPEHAPFVAIAGLAFAASLAADASAGRRSNASLAAPLVRRRVTRLILGFIVIDAWVAAMSAGWPSGVCVLALLVPSRIAARWAAMT